MVDNEALSIPPPEDLGQYGQAAPGETEAKPYRVEVLTQYSDEVAAGIGRLMHQLDNEAFSDEPIERGQLEGIIASPFHDQIVAYGEGNAVVGVATMSTIMEPKFSEGYLGAFVVDENMRSQGIADGLWDGMIAWCASKGYSKFSFGSETWRPDALRFYEKKGAELDETSRHLTMKLPEVN